MHFPWIRTTPLPMGVMRPFASFYAFQFLLERANLGEARLSTRKSKPTVASRSKKKRSIFTWPLESGVGGIRSTGGLRGFRDSVTKNRHPSRYTHTHTRTRALGNVSPNGSGGVTLKVINLQLKTSPTCSRPKFSL